MMKPAVLVVLPCLVAPAAAAATNPIEHIGVEVAFADGDWRLQIDPGGRVRGFVGPTPFSSTSVPEATLRRIWALARCVAVLPEPAIPPPPVLEGAAGPTPVALLSVRARTGRGRVLERRIRASEDTLERTDLSNDVGPALRLLVELRDLVPTASAYDYRPWLRRLVPKRSDPRCPWLTDLWGE
jgi:hypothetical protein